MKSMAMPKVKIHIQAEGFGDLASGFRFGGKNNHSTGLSYLYVDDIAILHESEPNGRVNRVIELDEGSHRLVWRNAGVGNAEFLRLDTTVKVYNVESGELIFESKENNTGQSFEVWDIYGKGVGKIFIVKKPLKTIDDFSVSPLTTRQKIESVCKDKFVNVYSYMCSGENNDPNQVCKWVLISSGQMSCNNIEILRKTKNKKVDIIQENQVKTVSAKDIQNQANQLNQQRARKQAEQKIFKEPFTTIEKKLASPIIPEQREKTVKPNIKPLILGAGILLLGMR